MTSRQCGRKGRAARPPRYRVRAPRGRRRIWVVRRARAAVRVPGVRVETTGRRTYDERSVTSTPHRRHARTFPSDRTPNGIVPIPLAPAHAVTRTALRAGPPARVVGARGSVGDAKITSGPNARASRALSRVEGARVSNHISQALRRRGLDPSGPMEDTRRRHGSTQPHAPPRPRPRRKRHNHTRELTRTPGSHQSRRT